MIKLTDLLKENDATPHSYGCVMLYFNFPEINKIHNVIRPDHVFNDETDPTFGLETEPHTTLLYGLHPEVTIDNVKDVLKNYDYSHCDIYNPSLFENEKYDVLKYDVNGKNLHETNKHLREYPFTSDFPDYHPHLTVAYLKKGLGKKYAKILENSKYKLKPTHAVYLQYNGIKTKLPIVLI